MISVHGGTATADSAAGMLQRSQSLLLPIPKMGHKRAFAVDASSPGASGSGTSDAVGAATGVSCASAPISKRNRPWKAPRPVRSSKVRNGMGTGLTWEQKMAQREKNKVLKEAVRAAREEDQAAKDAERKRRYEKRKRKEENEMKSAKKVMITNPKKLAKMSKKQFLNHVQKNK